MKKITLAVLFGGSSTEYEISLQSAHAVLTHLDRDRYEPSSWASHGMGAGCSTRGRWTPCWTTLGTPTPAIPSRR